MTVYQSDMTDMELAREVAGVIVECWPTRPPGIPEESLRGEILFWVGYFLACRRIKQHLAWREWERMVEASPAGVPFNAGSSTKDCRLPPLRHKPTVFCHWGDGLLTNGDFS